MIELIRKIDLNYILYYLLIISIVGVFAIFYDKAASKYRPQTRVREKSLFILGALGGAFAMYITMKLIRHKTQHNSFMILFPIFIVGHIIIALLVKFL